MLLLVEVAAKTSTKRFVSSALIPNAVIASVTMSDAVARSIEDAAARFRTPSIPSSISSVFQPANAIYPSASADCEAVKEVFFPISSAFSVKAPISSAVAPERALTLLIEDVNVIPVSTAERDRFLNPSIPF